MVAFVSKRLQVFVSSTYSDLIEERQAAVGAILTAGHIPAGMELFTSGDESQMDVIKQWIDESDVFLLILGGRYGSVEPTTSKSYTQLEYEYALQQNKPLFACVITEEALELRVKEHGTRMFETDNPNELREFRALVLTKLVRFWEDAKDIKIAIGETLSQFSRREDLVGWVKANQEVNAAALADEIARLSKENAQLRTQLAQSNAGDDFNGLRYDELLGLLESKGLLDLLIANRTKLSVPFSSRRFGTGEEKLKELAALGVIDFSHVEQSRFGPTYLYRLSNAGRLFLNRYEMHHNADGDVTPSQKGEKST